MTLIDDVQSRRLGRIRLLATELNEKSLLNTSASRGRCRRIALELIELFKAEDAYARGTLPAPADGRRSLRRNPS